MTITHPKDKAVKTKETVIRGITNDEEILVSVNETDYNPTISQGEWSIHVELDHGVNTIEERVGGQVVDSITVYNLEMPDLEPVYSVKTDDSMVISGYSRAGTVELEYNGITYKENPDHLNYFEFTIPLPAEDDTLMLRAKSGENFSKEIEVEVPEYNLENLLTKLKQDYHMIKDTIDSDIYNDQLSITLFYTNAIKRVIAVLNTLMRKRLALPDLQSKMEQLTLYDLIYDEAVKESSNAGSDFQLTNGSPISLNMPALSSDGDIALLVYMKSKPDSYDITISETDSTDEVVEIINPGEYSAYVIDVSSVISDPDGSSSTINISTTTSKTIYINNDDRKAKLLLNYRGDFD